MIFYNHRIPPACPAIICEVGYKGLIPDRMNRIPDQRTRSNKAYYRYFFGYFLANNLWSAHYQKKGNNKFIKSLYH
jgi:hypothetical protein